MSYVPLWVKSNYSFLEGASHPEELVETGIRWELPALAITDRDGVYGVVRAYQQARRSGLRILFGAQVTVRTNALCSNLVLLAKTRSGWASLCRLLSRGQLRHEKGEACVTLEEVMGSAAGLVALCRHPAWLSLLVEAYQKDLFALVTRHLEAHEVPHEQRLRAQARALGVSPVAGMEVLYHDPCRRALADVLACIRHGCSLDEAGRRLPSNAEHTLLSPPRFTRRFQDDPEAVERTLEIAERCQFHLGEIRYRYPTETLPEGGTTREHLRALTWQGARQRYGNRIPAAIQAQLERELQLIHELEYEGYFLTMQEIVDFCQTNHILCQGRGSAANSVVCYCLGITAIDPVRMELLFERFLSRERAEPPDIDLDIEHERREEVIQYVYQKYGRRRAAMVANVIRYRTRSAVRDVGKALGLPLVEIDTVARVLGRSTDPPSPDALSAAGIDASAPSAQLLVSLTTAILNFPRHLSIHPGGFLLGHEPVDTLVPIEPARMEQRTVIQWDKQDIEDLGLFKVDLLGLGCLTAIHRCFDLLKEHADLDLSLAEVPAEDRETYEMISNADTIGVFQIESRAQMAMLPRLRPKTFYDLVIEVAIVRPGPIQGDMVHPYLRRRSGLEEVTYPHPKLERVLRKTLGVPIFQEQVMKLAMAVADYTPGEADQLRRDMAAWRSHGRMERHRDRLIARMKANGIDESFAERIFSQIQGFGEYGFPESHSASFSHLAYITAWLKRHHPAAFVCAMLNAQPMGFYSPSTLVEDAKRHGVEVLPIDINQSRWDCHLETRNTLRMGFRYVQGLLAQERESLENPRRPWSSLESFIRTTRLNQRSLIRLAEVGALDSLGLTRREALWEVRSLALYAHDPLPLSPAPRRAEFCPLSPAETISWDYRRSRHSPRGHPMAGFRRTLQTRGIPSAQELNLLSDGKLLDYVGMVIVRQRPMTASGVTFFTLEDETGLVNVVLWKQVFDRYALLGKTATLLGVHGKLQVAEGVTHLVAQRLWEPQQLWESQGIRNRRPDSGRPRSRDFH